MKSRNTRSSSFFILTFSDVDFPKLDRGIQRCCKSNGSRGQASGSRCFDLSNRKTKVSSSKGFIFLITLLIILVISLFVLTSMQHILLHHKAINKQEELHRNFYQLEDVAMQLASKGLSSADKACVIYNDEPNEVLQNLLHSQGCLLVKSLHYQYFIEDLGEFPCLVVHYNGQNRATHHSRISVVQIEDGVPMSFLQIRYIAPGGMKNCLEKEHFIGLGISSWRYVPSI